MSSYKYIDPIKRGYIRFKLTKKQHNNLFPKRKIKWTDRYEYYYNDKLKLITLNKFYSRKLLFLQTVLLPIIILLGGIVHAKEIFKETIEMYKQKELGHFISDTIDAKHKKYQEVMDIIKKIKKR